LGFPAPCVGTRRKYLIPKADGIMGTHNIKPPHLTRHGPLANVYTMTYIAGSAMNFEWDEAKNAANFDKHGIWFEEAQTVWADPHAMEFLDPDHSATEDRFIRIGYSTRGRILLVVFCERNGSETVRIISARKATSKEVKTYEEGI